MKKAVFFIIVTFVLIISGYLFLKNTTRPIIYSGLSARAKEYVNLQKTKDNTQWNTIDLSANRSIQNFQDSMITNECFSLKIPFTVLKNKSTGQCSQYITFDSPRGEITVYQVDASTANLDENPVIIMRRANKNIYNESSVVVDDREFILFKEKADNFKEIAFSQENNALFVLNINAYTNDDLTTQFNQILRSIVYK